MNTQAAAGGATAAGGREPSSRELVLTRVFDAPRDLVWKAFTEVDRLKQWWGPKGFRMLTCRLDLRPGGIFLYGMQSPDGHEMWGKWTFREIVARSGSSSSSRSPTRTRASRGTRSRRTGRAKCWAR